MFHLLINHNNVSSNNDVVIGQCNMFSYIFSVVPLIGTFVLFSFWVYSYVYNHEFIQEYSGKEMSRNQINELISKLNHTYKLSLHSIDDSHDSGTYDSKLIFIDQISRVKHFVIGVVFTLTVSMSLQLITLMMCELVNLFDESARLGLFSFTIDCLMVLIILVQPFLLINLVVVQDLVPQPRQNYVKTTVSLALVVLWFFILHKCGDLSQSFQPSYSQYDTKTFIEKKINEIGITGITVLAIISGIGSSSTPYKLFYDTYMSKPVKYLSELDLSNSILSYNHTNLLLLKRKSQLNNYLVETGGTVYNTPATSPSSENLHNLKSPKNKLGGIFHKVQSFASLSSLALNNDPQEIEYRHEIKSLKSLRANLLKELRVNLVNYEKQKQLLDNESRPSAKLLKIFNISFSIYGVYRILDVIVIKLPRAYARLTSDNVNENLPEVSRDALAVTFSKLITTVLPDFPLTEEMLTVQISFILTGGLFLCSISNVVITFNQFGKYLPIANTSHVIRNWIKHLVIGELIGIYVIATAILIRTNLPLTVSQQISKILSLSGTSKSTPQIAMKEIEFIDLWFDKIFAITSIITIIIITIRQKIDEEEYDEEIMIGK